MDAPSGEPRKATNPEAVPLTGEQHQRIRQTIDDAREAKILLRHSAPTKILGWVLIGGFSLFFIGGLFRSHVDFNCLLLAFAGWAILQGNASWLRFVILMVVPAAAAGVIICLGAIILRRPIEMADKWVDAGDLDFWLLGVSPAFFFLGIGILAVVTLRSRKIRFWTKAVKTYSGIIAAILVIASVPATIKWQRERALKQLLSKEIQAARSHVLTFGGTFSSSSISFANQAFEPLAKVVTVYWNSSPRSRSQIYERPPASTPDEPFTYTEMLQLPSGDWGELEIELLVPDSP